MVPLFCNYYFSFEVDYVLISLSLSTYAMLESSKIISIIFKFGFNAKTGIGQMEKIGR